MRRPGLGIAGRLGGSDEHVDRAVGDAAPVKAEPGDAVAAHSRDFKLPLSSVVHVFQPAGQSEGGICSPGGPSSRKPYQLATWSSDMVPEASNASGSTLSLTTPMIRTRTETPATGRPWASTTPPDWQVVALQVERRLAGVGHVAGLDPARGKACGGGRDLGQVPAWGPFGCEIARRFVEVEMKSAV